MRCKLCGSTRHFLAEVKEYRIIDTENPYKLINYGVPVVVHCLNASCTGSSLDGNIEFDPIPTALSRLKNEIEKYRGQV